MNGKKVVSILLFIVSIAMIGSGVYLMNSKKYIFETAVKEVFENLTKSGEDIFLLDELGSSDKYRITTDTSLTMMGEEFASVNGDLYISNNNLYLNIDSSLAGEDFIGLEGLVDEERIYFKLKEIMENFYYDEITSTVDDAVSMNDLSTIEDIERDEINLLINLLRDSILKDLKDEDLDKTSVTLNLGSEEFKTSKISFGISEKRFIQIMINYLDAISNDTEAIRVLQKIDSEITKETIDEAKTTLEEGIEQYGEEDILSFAFYLEGFNNIRRVELSTAGSGEVDSIATGVLSITFDTYTNSDNKKVNDFNIVQNEMTLISMEEVYNTDNDINITIEFNDGEQIAKFSGNMTREDNGTTVNLNALLDDEEIANITFGVTRVTQNEEYTLELSFTEATTEMRLSSINNIYLNEDLPSVDTSDADSIDNLTEEEMAEIQAYIAERLSILGLFEQTPEIPNPNDSLSPYYDDTLLEDDNL